jgi:hypothetical protein
MEDLRVTVTTAFTSKPASLVNQGLVAEMPLGIHRRPEPLTSDFTGKLRIQL